MGAFDHDAELRRYHRRLHEAADVQPDDHVLDIGCGAGEPTRAAAQRATRGSALGADLSASTIARAERAAADVPNVRFAQVHPFPPAAFTLGLSRFGTMFFEDPPAAFANVARALRLGQLVWQERRGRNGSPRSTARSPRPIRRPAPRAATPSPPPIPRLSEVSSPRTASPTSNWLACANQSGTAPIPPRHSTRCSSSAKRATCSPPATPVSKTEPAPGCPPK
ncbi:MULTISPECIES: class I SAM-dependent methyltransferase [Amycolatopsis]|uniref:class I SAM-dependent methyltransferase n=1 Tax=Amycolatopsis TaxID=1813 RepID=UPI001E4EBF10|nr:MULTISPECIES: class I SAM-dependent methyltransferase [Amycolatopsis]